MTPSGVWLIAAAAALVMIGVHALYLGARQRITVATLKPFDTKSRPRLTLSAITERALLLLRLALAAVVALIVLAEQPDRAAGEGREAVVAVVPGTAPPKVEDGARYVWLDGAATPLTQAPLRRDIPAGALLALEQSLDAGTRLAVSGALPARHWPEWMPQFGRDIQWRSAEIDDGADDWSTAGAPDSLTIVGEDAELEVAVRAAIALWRSAGLLPDTVSVRGETGAKGDARIVLGGAPPADARWTAGVVRTSAPHAGRVVPLDPTQAPGAFATALWHALTAAEGLRPAPAVAVVPLPAGAEGGVVVSGNAQRRRASPVAPGWLWLAVGLFLAERLLAARGVAS